MSLSMDRIYRLRDAERSFYAIERAGTLYRAAEDDIF